MKVEHGRTSRLFTSSLPDLFHFRQGDAEDVDPVNNWHRGRITWAQSESLGLADQECSGAVRKVCQRDSSLVMCLPEECLIRANKSKVHSPDSRRRFPCCRILASVSYLLYFISPHLHFEPSSSARLPVQIKHGKRRRESGECTFDLLARIKHSSGRHMTSEESRWQTFRTAPEHFIQDQKHHTSDLFLEISIIKLLGVLTSWSARPSDSDCAHVIRPRCQLLTGSTSSASP
ncbi:unnamed protein product [Protopolystoma xenopodis]|uniref:Uncharacterized protein n=1 Tax=Protopolystoma xenopodis TaxID=117903 RepID=A0A448WXW4_9PLAT|nr:unnamed protein product [Protopolystoma xenopodis]